jgi:uncharacterized protein
MTRTASIGTALTLGLMLAPGLYAGSLPATVASEAGWTFPAGLVERALEASGSPLTSASGPAAVLSGERADPIDTDWRTLLGLNYLTGETTAALESRRGKAVRIPGFMVPFEDGMSGVNEFLLVPYFGACIHTPPPPPNQIVYVRMARGQRVEVNIWDAVYVEGVLDIESIESPYGTVGHQVLGSAVKPYGRQR